MKYIKIIPEILGIDWAAAFLVFAAGYYIFTVWFALAIIALLVPLALALQHERLGKPALLFYLCFIPSFGTSIIALLSTHINVWTWIHTVNYWTYWLAGAVFVGMTIRRVLQYKSKPERESNGFANLWGY